MEELKFPFPGVRKCLVEAHSAHTLTLVNLIVEPEFRRQGVGTAALREIKRIARERDYRQIFLLVQPIGPPDEQVDMPDLKRFYRRSGFFVLSDNKTMLCYV